LGVINDRDSFFFFCQGARDISMEKVNDYELDENEHRKIA